jgi:hypothetical protein
MFRLPRIRQRGDEIFLALAFEFFLRGFEVCHACCDFFPLASQSILIHAHPFKS